MRVCRSEEAGELPAAGAVPGAPHFKALILNLLTPGHCALCRGEDGGELPAAVAAPAAPQPARWPAGPLAPDDEGLAAVHAQPPPRRSEDDDGAVAQVRRLSWMRGKCWRTGAVYMPCVCSNNTVRRV